MGLIGKARGRIFIYEAIDKFDVLTAEFDSVGRIKSADIGGEVIQLRSQPTVNAFA